MITLQLTNHFKTNNYEDYKLLLSQSFVHYSAFDAVRYLEQKNDKVRNPFADPFKSTFYNNHKLL